MQASCWPYFCGGVLYGFSYKFPQDITQGGIRTSLTSQLGDPSNERNSGKMAIAAVNASQRRAIKELEEFGFRLIKKYKNPNSRHMVRVYYYMWGNVE